MCCGKIYAVQVKNGKEDFVAKDMYVLKSKTQQLITKGFGLVKYYAFYIC